MKTRYTVALSMLAGTAIGAVAVQGLHAQAKPKAFVVTETEVLDAAALAAYSPLARAAADAAGARRISPPGGKTVAFVGEAPKRVGIQEWESLEKAQAFRNSDAFKKLTPQRDKAVKTMSVIRRRSELGFVTETEITLPRPPQWAASANPLIP